MARFEYFRVNENELDALKAQIMQSGIWGLSNFSNDKRSMAQIIIDEEYDCLCCLGLDGWEMVSALSSPKFNGLEFVFKRIYNKDVFMALNEYKAGLNDARKAMLENNKKKFDVNGRDVGGGGNVVI